MEVIKFCQSAFDFVLLSDHIAKRRDKFVTKILIPSQWHITKTELLRQCSLLYYTHCVIVNADSEPCFNPCGDKPVQLADSQGTIYSPGYDEKVYPNNAHCQWLIKAPDGFVRRISIALKERSQVK